VLAGSEATAQGGVLMDGGYHIIGKVSESRHNDRGGQWLIAGPDGKKVAYAATYDEAQRKLGSLRGRAARQAKRRKQQ
jgi:hypothetical protein